MALCPHLYTPKTTCLQSESYPEDEAASLQSIEKRIKEAKQFFVLAQIKGHNRIVGFVNGTLTSSSALTHESMFSHEPQGSMLCIHSVVVEKTHRRKGFAAEMLMSYLKRISAFENIRDVRLICKKHLISLYEKVGFQLVGPSAVVHGKDQWFEMMFQVIPV